MTGAPWPTVHLHAGELYVTAAPAAVQTILGSCVSVCLWDATRRVGGINHFLLPFPPGPAAASSRFGDVAMRRLLDGVLRAGASRPRLVARVFGGARITAIEGPADHLGARNVELAMRFLADERIRVAGVEVEGARGRRLVFSTEDGAVWIKTI